LVHEEALDVLSLGPGATAAEIKEAYRDLVKVWHPDRFGTDPRLRQKAEEKLQQINAAYHVLQSQSRSKPNERCTASTVKAAHSKQKVPSRRRYAWPSVVSRFHRNSVLWVCWLGSMIVFAAVLIALRHRAPPTTEAPETHTQVPDDVRHEIKPSPEAPSVPPKAAARMSHAASQGFRVRELSDAEAAQLESACPKTMRDSAAYQVCVAAQLGASQPDLSTLSADDRAGIESACRNTKIQNGSAAYNRCLTRMVKLLKESAQH